MSLLVEMVGNIEKITFGLTSTSGHVHSDLLDYNRTTEVKGDLEKSATIPN